MKVLLYINGHLWAEDSSPGAIEREAARMLHVHGDGKEARVLVMLEVGSYDDEHGFVWSHKDDNRGKR
jgi:hypothetical protein